MLVLISGVVLLTHKKPEPIGNLAVPLARNKNRSLGRRKPDDEEGGNNGQDGDNEREVLWSMEDHGEQDDDRSESGDDDIHHPHPVKRGLGLGEGQQSLIGGKGKDRMQTKKSRKAGMQGEEGISLIGETREEGEGELESDMNAVSEERYSSRSRAGSHGSVPVRDGFSNSWVIRRQY